MRKTGFMKLALVLAGAFLFAAGASAQNFTTVTGTVVDPNGIPYAGGSMSATLTPGSPGGWTLGGQPYSGRVGPITLDATGKFVANFGSNAAILPAGTQWVVTVNSNQGGIPPPLGTGPQTFSVTITISGASQDISATLDAAAPKLTNFVSPGGGVVACSTVGGIAFENGTANTLTCVPLLTYVNPTGSCGLTTAAVLTQCGTGSGSFIGNAALAENITNNDATWNMIFSNAAGTGNTGSTRKSFLAIGAQGSAFGNDISLEYIVNGVDLAFLEFGSATSGITLGTHGKVNEVGAFGAIDPNAVTETWYQPDGDIRWLTPAGFGGCFQGSTSGQACLDVSATGDTLQQFAQPGQTKPLRDISNGSTVTPQGTVTIRGTGLGDCDAAGAPCLLQIISENGDTQIMLVDRAAAALDVGYLFQSGGKTIVGGYNATNEVESNYNIDTGVYTLRTGLDAIAETVDASQNATWTGFVASPTLKFSTSLVNGASGHLLESTTAPSIVAGGCGGAAAAITVNNGTFAFTVNVGTGNSGTCTVTMPAAPTNWVCGATDITTTSTLVSITKSVPGGTPTTQITLQNYTDVSATHAWVDSDKIQVGCAAE